MDPSKPALVAFGGIAGATIRWAVLDLADQADWALVGVNAIGAFLLGLLVHGAVRRDVRRRLLVGVGFCGSLTTFSTLAVDIAADLDRGATGPALVLLAASIVIGLAAGAAGLAIRRRPA